MIGIYLPRAAVVNCGINRTQPVQNVPTSILFRVQFAGEFMVPVDKDKKQDVAEPEDTNEPKGDPEMAPVYLGRLLPVFCETFQSTMLPSVRKASLTLIKKMVHYIQPSLLVETCSPESATYNLGTMLVEVIATVLDNEVKYLLCVSYRC